jgi:hypothetical protein
MATIFLLGAMGGSNHMDHTWKTFYDVETTINRCEPCDRILKGLESGELIKVLFQILSADGLIKVGILFLSSF